MISLAGDTHNSWVSKLHDLQGEGVGFEFGTPSVTSPGLLDIIKIKKNVLEDSIISANNEVRWMDAESRGFLKRFLEKETISPMASSGLISFNSANLFLEIYHFFF